MAAVNVPTGLVPYYRRYDLPWAPSEETERRFRAILRNLAIVFAIVAVILALTPTDFYKFMTTHADHTVWQDVYRPTTNAGEIYLKLTVINEVLIVSFKEL